MDLAVDTKLPVTLNEIQQFLFVARQMIKRYGALRST
jgi:hypothetical protein